MSYANVMATIAVFIALGGGAYAVTAPRNSIGEKQIRANAVGAAELKRNSVRPAEIRSNAVGGNEIRHGAIGTDDLGDGTVQGIDLATQSIRADNLADGSVIGRTIVAGSIGLPHLAVPLLTDGAAIDAGLKLDVQQDPQFRDVAETTINLRQLSGLAFHATAEADNPSNSGTPGVSGRITLRILYDGQPFFYLVSISPLETHQPQFVTTVADGETQSAPLTIGAGANDWGYQPGEHTVTLQAKVEDAPLNVSDAGLSVIVLPGR